MLNCQKHDVPVLIAAKLLKPLGKPAPNSIKFFATADVLALGQDAAKLAKMTQVIYDHWQNKNARKKRSQTETPGLPGLTATVDVQFAAHGDCAESGAAIGAGRRS